LTALDAAVAALQKIDQLRANKGQMTGVATGYPQMDRLTNGWQAPDLIILAARPSMGKTAFALNLLKNAAASGTPSAFFSLEMSTKQLINRILSEESKVPLENITRGKMTDQEYTDFVKATDTIAALPMFFDDTASINIFQIRSKVRKLFKQNGVRFVIIDYLQLMSGMKSKNENREQEISTISRSLKALAKELDIPIIALSQLSRAVESRDGNKPKLSDLRESGAIEQDADIVGFIYRPDYQKEVKDIDPMDANKGFVSFKKHRNGALETLAFHVDLSIQKWSDPFEAQTQQANNEGWQQLPPPDEGAQLFIQNDINEPPPF
jgi:replicative DNA helicase